MTLGRPTTRMTLGIGRARWRRGRSPAPGRRWVRVPVLVMVQFHHPVSMQADLCTSVLSLHCLGSGHAGSSGLPQVDVCYFEFD
jgi:hypothetical protein